MKVLVTGGHVTPALAVMEELKEADLVFVGRRRALATDERDSFEYQEVARKGIRFIDLKAGRLTRLASVRSLINVLKIPLGFAKAFYIVKKEKPDVVLSFGGYIAVPIAISAAFLRIPVVTHEQTIHPGIGNRVIGWFASKVFVAFEEAKKFFLRKASVVGNPIRSELFEIQQTISPFPKDRKVIVVMGGSLGSHSVNEHIFTILPELLKKYTVIHQTGSATEYGDDVRASLIKHKHYFAFSHIPTELLGFVLDSADLIISRAGANTYFEILALKKPSILIPLPWAAENEQRKHAEELVKYGVAKIFGQDLRSVELLAMIEEMVATLEKYRKNFDTIKLSYERNSAAKQIAQAVQEAIRSRNSS